jgi:hypothetical protein
VPEIIAGRADSSRCRRLLELQDEDGMTERSFGNRAEGIIESQIGAALTKRLAFNIFLGYENIYGGRSTFSRFFDC